MAGPLDCMRAAAGGACERAYRRMWVLALSWCLMQASTQRSVSTHARLSAVVHPRQIWRHNDSSERRTCAWEPERVTTQSINRRCCTCSCAGTPNASIGRAMNGRAFTRDMHRMEGLHQSDAPCATSPSGKPPNPGHHHCYVP